MGITISVVLVLRESFSGQRLWFPHFIGHSFNALHTVGLKWSLTADWLTLYYICAYIHVCKGPKNAGTKMTFMFLFI